eukprot:764116-Hanusia_phi.AAC.6
MLAPILRVRWRVQPLSVADALIFDCLTTPTRQLRESRSDMCCHGGDCDDLLGNKRAVWVFLCMESEFHLPRMKVSHVFPSELTSPPLNVSLLALEMAGPQVYLPVRLHSNVRGLLWQGNGADFPYAATGSPLTFPSSTLLETCLCMNMEAIRYSLCPWPVCDMDTK